MHGTYFACTLMPRPPSQYTPSYHPTVCYVYAYIVGTCMHTEECAKTFGICVRSSSRPGEQRTETPMQLAEEEGCTIKLINCRKYQVDGSNPWANIVTMHREHFTLGQLVLCSVVYVAQCSVVCSVGSSCCSPGLLGITVKVATMRLQVQHCQWLLKACILPCFRFLALWPLYLEPPRAAPAFAR